MTFPKSLSIHISIICLLFALFSALAACVHFPQSAQVETLTFDWMGSIAAATTSGTSLSETAIPLSSLL